MNRIEEGPSVTDFETTNLVNRHVGIGATPAVDAEIDPLTAAMFVADASVTATMRVLRFAV
jgi:hypothetical protein